METVLTRDDLIDKPVGDDKEKKRTVSFDVLQSAPFPPKKKVAKLPIDDSSNDYEDLGSKKHPLFSNDKVVQYDKTADQLRNDGQAELNSCPHNNEALQLRVIIDNSLNVDDNLLGILEYCDIITLVKNQRVCRRWKKLCVQVIESNYPRSFKTREELKLAVDKYMEKDNGSQMKLLKAKYGWPIGKWNVSRIDDFSFLFSSSQEEGAAVDLEDADYEETPSGHAFNENISEWDVSNARDMSGMFFGANQFNQDLSSWNVSNVTCMVDMFHNAEAFNHDLSNWDVSKVTVMSGMFCYATSFNQNLLEWDVSEVKDMSYMFLAATSFNQDISSWNVCNVVDMNYMFNQAHSFDQDISSWNVSKVSTMKSMFAEALTFNQDISTWNVSNVANMSNMFDIAVAFDQDLSNWVVSGNTETQDMFLLSRTTDPSRFPRQEDGDT